MGKFIITEEEKQYIKSLYEQQPTSGTSQQSNVEEGDLSNLYLDSFNKIIKPKMEEVKSKFPERETNRGMMRLGYYTVSKQFTYSFPYEVGVSLTLFINQDGHSRNYFVVSLGEKDFKYYGQNLNNKNQIDKAAQDALNDFVFRASHAYSYLWPI